MRWKVTIEGMDEFGGRGWTIEKQKTVERPELYSGFR